MAIGNCIEEGIDILSDAFTDTSGLSIQYDNLGTATVSFVILHRGGQLFSGGNVSFIINSRQYVGTIASIIPSDLEGTEYTESRITFVGFGC